MVRLIGFMVLVVSIMLLAGCAVNSTTGSIILQNNTDKAVTLKVGTTSLYAASGGSNMSYFVAEAKNLSVSVDGVTAETGIYYFTGSGLVKYSSVNTKFGYQLNFSVILSSGKYYIMISPVYVGDQSNSKITDLLNS